MNNVCSDGVSFTNIFTYIVWTLAGQLANFICQLIQVSPFTNVVTFAMYGICSGMAKMGNTKAQNQPIAFSAQPVGCQKDK